MRGHLSSDPTVVFESWLTVRAIHGTLNCCWLVQHFRPVGALHCFIRRTEDAACLSIREDPVLMEISEKLLCVFSAEIEEQGDSYVIEVPKRELSNGDVELNKVYRTVLSQTHSSTTDSDNRSEQNQESPKPTHPEPPATEGETRTLEIEDIGEQGDGIARVECGYVIIVPSTKQGDRVKVKITDVRENVAFAEVLEQS